MMWQFTVKIDGPRIILEADRWFDAREVARVALGSDRLILLAINHESVAELRSLVAEHPREWPKRLQKITYSIRWSGNAATRNSTLQKNIFNFEGDPCPIPNLQPRTVSRRKTRTQP